MLVYSKGSNGENANIAAIEKAETAFFLILPQTHSFPDPRRFLSFHLSPYIITSY